jgi:hypothetical protein
MGDVGSKLRLVGVCFRRGVHFLLSGARSNIFFDPAVLHVIAFQMIGGSTCGGRHLLALQDAVG